MKHTRNQIKYTKELQYSSSIPIEEEFRTFIYSDYGEITVNNLGTKIYTKTGKTPPIYEDDSGYLGITVNGVNCKSHFLRIHRAVALAFIPNPDNLPEVNHIDLDKKNNCVTNLEWITGIDNVQHAINMGFSHSRPGVQNGRAKLTEENVSYIRSHYKRGEGVKLAKQFNVSSSMIYYIVKNQNWKEEEGGDAT